MDEDRLRTALKDCLSDADFPLERQWSVLRMAKGDERMGKKAVMTVVLACLCLLGSVAIAVNLGVFASFADDLMSEMSATRLRVLDDVADGIAQNVVLTTPNENLNGATNLSDAQEILAHLAGRTYVLTIDQAYCDGQKLYFSYTLRTDALWLRHGEGKPTGIDEWDGFVPGASFCSVWGLRDPDETARIAGWLSEHEASYVIRETLGLGDGASVNGEPLNVYDSNAEWTDENTLTGFQEVALPEGYEAGTELNVRFTVHYGATVYYQDETGVYEKYLAQSENCGILTADVILPVNGSVKELSGLIETDGYAAEAKLYVSDVDIHGEVRLSGVAHWLKSDDPFDRTSEAIGNYTLIAGDEELRNLDGSISGIVDGAYVIGVRYDLPKHTDGLILRPTDAPDRADDIELR